MTECWAGGVSVVSSLAFSLCACSFTPGAVPARDGSLEPGSDADAGDVQPDGSTEDAPPPCALGPWSTPQPITELNAGTFDAQPRLTADERTVVFHAIRTGGTGNRDLWTATRASLADPFGTPTPLSELNSTGQDRDATVTADGLTLVYASTRDGGEHDIYLATRTSLAVAFGTPQPIDEINTTGREYFSMLSADGLTLYFSSDRSGGSGSYDVWSITRTDPSAQFTGTPANFTAINSTGPEYGVIVSADGLELYLSAGTGGPDIARATRATTSDAFSTPVAVAELNSAVEDHAGWLSTDGRRLYLSSDRSGVFRIYLATRACI